MILKKSKLLIGGNEWCELPGLKIPAIKAKIDTGAQTSAIHAFNIKPRIKHGKKHVEFDLHPLQANNDIVITCCKPVIDERSIMSSNGHKENRYVIETVLGLGGQQWKIELTLSNRDPLRFRLLLGRQALNHRVLIDPALNCHHGTIRKSELLALYQDHL